MRAHVATRTHARSRPPAGPQLCVWTGCRALVILLKRLPNSQLPVPAAPWGSRVPHSGRRAGRAGLETQDLHPRGRAEDSLLGSEVCLRKVTLHSAKGSHMSMPQLKGRCRKQRSGRPPPPSRSGLLLPGTSRVTAIVSLPEACESRTSSSSPWGGCPHARVCSPGQTQGGAGATTEQGTCSVHLPSACAAESPTPVSQVGR